MYSRECFVVGYSGVFPGGGELVITMVVRVFVALYSSNPFDFGIWSQEYHFHCGGIFSQLWGCWIDREFFSFFTLTPSMMGIS